MKVYISPSQQSNNIGYGSYGSEMSRMFEIGDALGVMFQRCNIPFVIAKKGMTFQEAAADSNANKCTIHLCIHSNASDGTHRGVLGMYCSTEGKKLTTDIYNRIAAFTTTVDQGIKENYSLYELTQTKAVAAYTEVMFHDNKEDATLIISNIKKIAELIARGTCDYLNVKFVEESVVMYKVITGSFINKNNAEILVASLKRYGFDSYIVEGKI
jgi:N-acetylmuramoyl-L-alanine amidase